jgi:hypothetical protein
MTVSGASDVFWPLRWHNIMPIAKAYSRASQSFLFARLTRAKHDHSAPDAGVRHVMSGRVS